MILICSLTLTVLCIKVNPDCYVLLWHLSPDGSKVISLENTIKTNQVQSAVLLRCVFILVQRVSQISFVCFQFATFYRFNISMGMVCMSKDPTHLNQVLSRDEQGQHLFFFAIERSYCQVEIYS